MGLRNPSRLYVDPETDIPYSAWVGPDAGAPSATPGPVDVRERGAARRAGNYGWPYCMGNEQAYRDRIADGTLRTDQRAGLRERRARERQHRRAGTTATTSSTTRRTTPAWSSSRTRPAPGRTRARRAPINLWYSRGNPGGANGCPEFPRERGADAAPNYGGTPTQLCPYLSDDGHDRSSTARSTATTTTATDNSRALARVLGRPLVPARHRRRRAPSTALLLDPATDQDGGKPVYADSLRGVLNWDAELHGLEVRARRRALRAGLRRLLPTGPNAGIYRFDYTGGPTTPGADPQGVPDGAPRGPLLARRLGRRLLRVGLRRRQRRPRRSRTRRTRTPTAGTYTATLTVTYADGDDGQRRTVDVDVIAAVDDDAADHDGDDRPGRARTAQGRSRSRSTRPTARRHAASSGPSTASTAAHWQEYTGPFTLSEPDDVHGRVPLGRTARATRRPRKTLHVHDHGAR